MLERNRQLEKQLNSCRPAAASAAGTISPTRLLRSRVPGPRRPPGWQDGKALLALVDQLKNKLGHAVILLGSEHEGKVVLVAGVTKDLSSQRLAI